MKLKKILLIGFIVAIVVVGGLIILAFARTRGKTDVEFRIHINKELVQQSTFG
jgi:hypothetical protein